jgi:hypothetical protein
MLFAISKARCTPPVRGHDFGGEQEVDGETRKERERDRWVERRGEEKGREERRRGKRGKRADH